MADQLNVIVDLSHQNGSVDLARAQAAGILGVIHKATQGTAFFDPMYQNNRVKAQEAGLLWGAYHFGVGADGVEQADHFLQVVRPGPLDLLVLDFESNPQGPTMTLEEARAFVTHINETLGRFPGFYSGHDIKQALGTGTDPVLAKCWFWLAQYGPTSVVPVNWTTWTLWQYTDGALGPEPHEVPGIGRCDRDKFNGDLAALKTLWGGGGLAPQEPTVLPPPAPGQGERTLRLQTPPMQGDDVTALQQALVAAGITVAVDGIFGTRTDAAVKQFQAQQGLIVDGIVGRATRSALGL